jgi:hypothetical protein
MSYVQNEAQALIRIKNSIRYKARSYLKNQWQSYLQITFKATYNSRVSENVIRECVDKVS